MAGVRPDSESAATDAQLLEQFFRGREGEAFAELVRRHGPMVFGVCRRVLQRPQETEDAFQATFLILVRRADSVGRPELLADWLHGVAYRVATRARADAFRRQALERQVVDVPTPEPPEDVEWRDLRPVLDEELQRLPEKYRALVILCYLEGKTSAAAAAALGMAEGTVSDWLARARERLRQRLTRRGVMLPAAALTAVLSRHAAAEVPAALVQATAQGATLLASGSAAAIPAPVLGMAQGAVRATSGMLRMMELFLLGTSLLLGLGVLCLWPPFDTTRAELLTRNEIDQLGIALENFKSEFGSYPPSRLLLCEQLGDYAAPDVVSRHPANLIADSRYYLLKMFPRMARDWEAKGFDFDQSGAYSAPVVLWGDQCLVFFLGGIPAQTAGGPSCRGFATDPRDPIPKAAATTRGPYFDFQPRRLVSRHGNAFYSYLDAFGKQPYAYFSSGRSRNNYNRYGDSDCAPLGVWPYAASLGRPPAYHNPNTYQIISAGRDGRFGSGTVPPDGRVWTPQSAKDIDADGRDDLSNFNALLLGDR